ncbi:MAG: DUF3160 domain-containing protein [Cyanobacteria bacterium SZAS TMP-1]|nr:DUF3160 domain-containing protein [Cyanobacteria bacterium SZAS TMP-1]
MTARLKNTALALLVSLTGPWLAQSAVLAQTSADGMRVGPSLDDVRRKRTLDREKALQDLNSPASGPLTLQRQPNLSDMFPSVSMGLVPPTPMSLEGVKIPGLSNKSVSTLAMNGFIVVHGNSFHFPTMAELYRDNRLNNRSNFITADVFTHLYFVLTNTLFVKVIDQALYGELETLLKELIDSCVSDYRACDIAEVKDDIQRNLAFVIVAASLLDPKIDLPDMGGASDLAKSDLAAISRGGKGRSVIFNREQDFSTFRPIGFYATTARTANFYRASAWLSSMYFPLTDVTNNSETGGGNTFRRAVLLYRALELGKAKDGASLLSHWQHVLEVYSIITMGRLTREPSVYPKDLRSMFSTAGKLDFKDLLYTLAQPLSRARLLLSIKKQRQVGLNAVSIFEIDKPKEADESLLVFRFLPPVMPYEMDWLRAPVKEFRDDGTSAGQYVNPLSLYIMYGWGASMASNILRNMVGNLDPTLFYGLSELVRTEGRRQRANDSTQAYQYPEKRWTLISEFFSPVKKGSQVILYSDSWMTQRLSSASGAFVDSLIAIDKSYKTELAPDKQVTGSIAPGGETKTGTVDAAAPAAAANYPSSSPKLSAARAAALVPVFHYLEPCPDYYKRLAVFTQLNESELIRLGAFPQSEKQKMGDFIRLLTRMVKICEKEISYEPLPPEDFRLLANFDQVLSAVDSPTAGSIYIPANSGTGASLGLGDAGPCFIIFNTDKGPYLSRGAVYTYYEVSGGPFKKEHWERKKTYGFLRPANWLAQYDFIQETAAAKAAPPKPAESGTGRPTLSDPGAGKIPFKELQILGKPLNPQGK